MMHTGLLFVALAAAAADPAPAPATPPLIKGYVTSCMDGDTVLVKSIDARLYRVRLNRIDAPEKAQARGPEAKAALEQLVLRRYVRIRWTEKDRYGRILGDLYVMRARKNVWVNRELVAQGWAWQYTRYDRSAAIRDAELDAREAGRGLWADEDPEAPWDWRARRR